jgi:hypothetical protein
MRRASPLQGAPRTTGRKPAEVGVRGLKQQTVLLVRAAMSIRPELPPWGLDVRHPVGSPRLTSDLLSATAEVVNEVHDGNAAHDVGRIQTESQSQIA